MEKEIEEKHGIFDTLTRLDTLTRFNTLIIQALGPNRQNTIMEVKIQHDNSCKYQRKGA